MQTLSILGMNMKRIPTENSTNKPGRLNVELWSRFTVLRAAISLSAMVLFSFVSDIVNPAHAQQANTCRTVYWGNGALRFQECNDVTIKHIDVAQNGAVWVDTDADELAGLGTSECIIGGGLRILATHPNSSELFAIIFNAFQRKRPLKLIRLKKTPGAQCDIDFVMSDL